MPFPSALPHPPLLGADFYALPTLEASRALLGQLLYCETPGGGAHLLRIVETEAYRQDDPACHAYRRKAGRAAMLYEAPGTAYVYFIYGMYDCLNVVSDPVDTAGAILIRAVEPLPGPDGQVPDLRTNGPSRLCKALGIRVATHNGLCLRDPASPLRLLQGAPIANERMLATTRIGISKGVDLPWRFYERGNPFVSVLAPEDPDRKRRPRRQALRPEA